MSFFGFGKKPAASVPKGAPRVARVTGQKRSAYRANVEFPVFYTVVGRDGMRTASANDLSNGGMRMVGDEDFAGDTEVTFLFTLPNDQIKGVQVEKEVEEITPRGKVKKIIMVPPDPFRPMSLRGKMVIAFLNVRRRKFMHGVQFIDVDDRTREEIQRFIHVWQIHQLRQRRMLRGE